MNADNNRNKDRVTVSYILNVIGFITPFHGLHRLYNGKIGTGLLWLCTLGLLGVGQFIDLFLIPSMVDEHEMRLRLKAGLSPTGVPLNEPTHTSQVYKASSKNKLIAKLIEAAEAKGGALTVTQGVKATGASFAEIESVFKEMLKSGYVRIDNDPITGAVTYHFHEL